MKPAQYTQPQYQDVGGVLPPISVRTINGLNAYDPLSIDDSYLTDSLNMTTRDFPAVSTRPGYRTIATFGRVLGMYTFGRYIHAIFSDGTWRRGLNSSTTFSWQTLTSGLLSSVIAYTFTAYQGEYDAPRIFVAGGSQVYMYDGTSVSVLNGAPSNSRFITTFQNRLWVMSGNELLACAVDSSTIWNRFNGGAGDSYGRQIETPDGTGVTGLAASTTFMLITSATSIQELTGTDPTNFSLRTVDEESGAANNTAITNMKGVYYTIGENGMFQYAGGTLPDSSFFEIISNRFKEKVLLGGPGVSAGVALGSIFMGDALRMYVYDPRQGVNAWSVWDGDIFLQSVEVEGDGFKMAPAISTATNKILLFDQTTDDGAPISWQITTKPFNNASMAQKQRWYKLFVTMTFTGSVQISLSNQVSGESWEQVVSLTGSGSPEVQRVIIPVQKYARENYIRIRIAGQGTCKIHEITRQARQLPLY